MYPIAKRKTTGTGSGHEFSKASFERSFVIDETVDSDNIVAEYYNGILHLNLPVIPGSDKPAQEIRII
ncbi:Hsp20/alpha crystallin family protein [Dyadobacter chenwenxiniae]|uniref:Hsp20 family protein n=1 Tax=Dyadobacter chenwenxiniae TaxID=2906456 RepID=UPI001FD5BE90|nr:Hsp20/alpha crystallin family protein [Dyadobacter chenwenxiniae]UON80769.1 Hsp20/alpha crystallin family protein [Dyadobacter chenwenxiniae]